MADLTVKAYRLSEQDTVLAQVVVLTPPMTPKGRYATAKYAMAISPAHALYQAQYRDLLEKHAKIVDGKPVTQTNDKGGTVYDLGLGFNVPTPEYLADLAALNDEDITLSGCRMVTHAELGPCPITVAQEMALLGTLLVDEAPE